MGRKRQVGRDKIATMKESSDASAAEQGVSFIPSLGHSV
jgi:hypothetical protein